MLLRALAILPLLPLVALPAASDPVATSVPHLAYAEPMLRTSARNAVPAALYDVDSTFRLHTAKGADRTIYLDLDGGVLSGTVWNSEKGVGSAYQPGFSLDGDPSTFTAEELAAVQNIWARVAEDYAPFDVDVTTEAPTTAALDRTSLLDGRFGSTAFITSSDEVIAKVCGGTCGGIAYTDVYDTVGNAHTYYQPALVLTDGLSNNIKAIGEAAAHETGHLLGLHHDGRGSNPYDTGSGTWAPIMGTSYQRPVTQWSRGDYPGATNTEDDLALITSGGLSLRPDEAGATTSGAPSVSGTATGFITGQYDADTWNVGSCDQTLTVTAGVAPAGANLDVQLSVLDSSGTEIGVANPAVAAVSADVATGLDASVSVPVTGGPFYARVAGSGAADYTSYGSVGAYALSVACGTPVAPTVPDGGTQPGAATTVPGRVRIGRATSGRVGGPSTLTVRWKAPRVGSPVTRYGITAYRLDARGRVTGTVVRSAGAARTSLTITAPRGRYYVVVRARGAGGWGEDSARSRVVLAR